MAWQETVQAVSSGITSGGIVIGGWWAYRRFVREAPHWTRADPAVRATLLELRGHDVLRVDVSVRALGQTRITFATEDGRAPVVSVYRFTEGMLQSLEPSEWTEILVAQRVLTGQHFVEAGETVGSSHLLPVGVRPPDTLAYRVEFTFWARDPNLRQDFSWGASDYAIAPTGENGEGEADGLSDQD